MHPTQLKRANGFGLIFALAFMPLAACERRIGGDNPEDNKTGIDRADLPPYFDLPGHCAYPESAPQVLMEGVEQIRYVLQSGCEAEILLRRVRGYFVELGYDELEYSLLVPQTEVGVGWRQVRFGKQWEGWWIDGDRGALALDVYQEVVDDQGTRVVYYADVTHYAAEPVKLMMQKFRRIHPSTTSQP